MYIYICVCVCVYVSMCRAYRMREGRCAPVGSTRWTGSRSYEYTAQLV